ncbi:hypothetical protein SCD_n01068 [Sulfuricella denitrificans skB26]|uniref:Uncharacterized protein n=1 Tax=Sulfuricella denitrificans (strain DSM 22764 / NBRC 105220 / skB26) TaxID=1163617 RepID=S6AJZ8_SULDS|nr:hypothetical protein SCD_n01068 [Sulfuricella denitrificans skB26]
MFLKAYMTNLQRQAAEQQATTASQLAVDQAQQKADHLRRWEPLVDQIARWFNAQPVALKNRRYHLNEICTNLHGRYQDTPHRGSVALALRQLGWQQRRDYTSRKGGVRYWVPPCTTK